MPGSRSSSSAWPRNSSRGPRARLRAGSVDCPATVAESVPWSRTWSRRLRRPSTCRPARMARGEASTTSTRTIRPLGRCTAWRPPPSTRRSRATTSRSPSSRSCLTCPPSVASVRASRVARTWRAGRSTRNAWPVRWASTGIPRERFGALESEAWRAARLVVDTGLHALGWTRQQSIDLLRERAGLSDLEAETETDRYISWPGQALSYMIGQREILDLRAQLERRDGDRLRPARLPRRDHRPRLAAALDAPGPAARLGQAPGRLSAAADGGRRPRRLRLARRVKLAPPRAPRGPGPAARPPRPRCTGQARRGPCRPARRARAPG